MGIRMTLPTKVVLLALSHAQHPMYGLQLVSECGLRSGSIHPILARLEQTGLVRSWWEVIDQSAEGRRRRRFYELTPEGMREAARLEQAEGERRTGWAVRPVAP